MQNSSPEVRFLAAVSRVAAVDLGADHPLSLAAGAAHSPASAARVHELLAQLTETERDRILAAVHREMREDLAAIWGFLPGAAQSGGMH